MTRYCLRSQAMVTNAKKDRDTCSHRSTEMSGRLWRKAADIDVPDATIGGMVAGLTPRSRKLSNSPTKNSQP